MRTWSIKINGETLRNTIEQGDSFQTLTELYNTVKQFTSRNKLDEDILFDFEELQEIVLSDISEGKEELIKFINEESYGTLTEYVDDKLSWFYDLCDLHNIWVTL